MNEGALTKYPAGAKVRVKQICGDPSNGQPGLLPIVGRTWLKWVETGKVPPGELIGPRTRVWPIETVLAVGRGEQPTQVQAERRPTASSLGVNLTT